MTHTDGPSDRIIDTLRERAKELNCLYSVYELLKSPRLPIEDVCRALLEIIPRGYQYPAECFARVLIGDRVFEPLDSTPTPWVQAARIVGDGEILGSVEVYYRREMPEADEGAFLKEERKLIDTIGEGIGRAILRRRPRGPARDREAEAPTGEQRDRGDWWVILDFLRKNDPPQLARITRRMVNHLCWNGVEEAQALLQRNAVFASDADPDDNSPLRRQNGALPSSMTEEAFRIASGHLTDRQIHECIEQWIKDDRSSFLSEAVEDQGTSLAEIASAIERYQQFAVSDRELSRPLQVGLRVSLTRRLLTEDLDFINRAKNFIGVEDFRDVLLRVIAPSGSHGKLGGKSAGLLLAAKIVRSSVEYADILGDLKVPKTWYITSDALLTFIASNDLEDVHNRKYLEVDQIRREYPHIVQVFKNSTFPPEILTGLSAALDDLGDRPLIVRSSSLLEDRSGAAFSGKYKSLFLANKGSKRERLAALADAIAEVYASVFSPDPIEYRSARGLLDLHEEMGIMIQEVVGSRVGPWFMPAWAGVGFSNNEFRWSARIQRDDGLLRLVPGLGTRAVDRLGDDYPVLVAPGKPGLRVNVTPDEVMRYAPRWVDAINLESGRFETVSFDELMRDHWTHYPGLRQMVSVLSDSEVLRPLGFEWDPAREQPVVTFSGLIADTPFVQRMRALLRVLREQTWGPVDIEFASDGTDLYLLQCRPQSYGEDAAPAPIPRDLPADRVLFSARRFVSNGRVPDVTHVVFVDPERYDAIGSLEDLRAVGRLVGRLNRLLPKRRFILVGPGRWGSRGDIKLGVSVTYADISNTSMLVEIAARRGQYAPDLSFGTHFFQDLVESSIRYLPLFPDEDSTLNLRFLRSAPNVVADVVSDAGPLADVVRVIDLPRTTGGLVLRVLMNADLEEAVAVLASPSDTVETAAGGRRPGDQQTEDHWRWRLRMAEQIAAVTDPERFGIKAMYVFGSTKNASAGPQSDVDLLVHFAGTPEQRRDLLLWLEGWSLSLSEMNYLRTGYKTEGLLDVHLVTDEEIAARTDFASKIGAITDAARPLQMMKP